MGKLAFDTKFFKSVVPSGSGDLPIEVRRPNATLVTKGIITDRPSVEPGKYFVTAKLPEGRDLTSEVTVIAGQEEVPVTFAGDISEFTVQALGAERLSGKFRFFRGNPFTGMIKELANPPVLEATSPNTIRVMESEGMQLFQMLRPNHMPINVSLPPRQECSISLVEHQVDSGMAEVVPEVHLRHPTAQLLIKFGESTRLNEVHYLAKNNFAKTLLYEKLEDPVAAALGAYALLKLGNTEDLRDWTKNLKDWFEWLPDGVPIRGEYLARIGLHSEALRTFLELPERGLPLFCYGLSYVIDRLTLYTGSSLDEKDIRSFDHDDREKARELLTALQRFAWCVDFQRPFLTYTGLRVDAPDRRQLSQADFNALSGVSLKSWFGEAKDRSEQGPPTGAMTAD